MGLIFMSAMTTSIAALCLGSDRMALGTALTWLAFSTILVGVAIVGVGKRKLATLVQYMPVCFLCQHSVASYFGTCKAFLEIWLYTVVSLHAPDESGGPTLPHARTCCFVCEEVRCGWLHAPSRPSAAPCARCG